MSVNDIVDELRATRPQASDALRLQVLAVASQPITRRPSLLDRVRPPRRLMLAVPAAAGLAVAAAIAVGVTRPAQEAREAGAPVTAGEQAAGSTTSTDAFSGPSADSATRAQKAAPGPALGRAQRYSATLALGVDSTDELSDATQRALGIVRDLGGFVVSARYATGIEGTSSLTLRVPSAKAADAVTRLSSLGTILAQDVQIQDLQEPLDGIDRELERLRAQLAAVTAQLGRAETAAERARLEERRSQVRAELQQLRASRAATAAEARTATIQLELRTEEGSSVVPPASRLDRALDRALDVLAWEAIVVLALAVAVAPIAVLGAAIWLARRMQRRRDDDRLLAAS
jgi:Domain of unknown function (DUF4349)